MSVCTGCGEEIRYGGPPCGCADGGLKAFMNRYKSAPSIQPDTPPDSDTISRTAAIQAIGKYNSDGALADILRSVPPVQTHDVATTNIAVNSTEDIFEPCSVEECTHARLASGSIVEIQDTTGGKVANLESSSKQILYSLWHELSITPVKREKKEPRVWEFDAYTANMAGYMPRHSAIGS